MTITDAHRAAAADAVAAFGIGRHELSAVSASENLTFRVDADGEAYVLRLHRPGYHTVEELDSEPIWLAALAESGLAVPRPITTPDDRHYVPVEVPGRGETRYAGLGHWAEGEIVGDLIHDNPDAVPLERYFAQLGELMAAMHDQAASWAPPAGFSRHRFDADGLFGERPFWGRFWDHPELTVDERAVLAAARDRCRAALDRYGEDRRTFSMIHADLHLGNLLVDGQRLSVIDFDDAGFGWHQYDIAIALFHTRDVGPAAELERQFIDAYRSVRPLADDDLALVPMFELIRGMALIGWKGQRPEVQWPDGYFTALKDDVVQRCARFEPPL